MFRGTTLTPVSSTGQALALSHDGRGDTRALILLDESLTQDTRDLEKADATRDENRDLHLHGNLD